jgi:hypothetical protein
LRKGFGCGAGVKVAAKQTFVGIEGKITCNDVVMEPEDQLNHSAFEVKFDSI